MPEHDPTTLPIKRMNYYQYQFLNAADFTAEQDYHRAMRYRHNRSLHSAGVADGLEVTPKGNQLAVEVAPGLAIDAEGREMVVLAPGKEVTLTGLDGDVFVAIEYRAVEDDAATSTGTPGNTRMSEDPHVFASEQQPTGDQILLANVTIANNVVTDVDSSTRPLASSVARADQVLSQQVREADGASGQNTNIGSGIKTGHLQDGAVTTPKLADDAVTSGKLAPADAATGQDVNNGTGVKTGHLQDAAVTGAKIQDASVSGTKLVDNSVQGGKLADNSVPGTKLQNLGVTGAKVADNSVPGTKLQDASVAGGKLTDNSVPGAKLQDLTVPGGKLADNSVHGSKLQDLTVVGTKLADNAVPGSKLQDLTVHGGKLMDNTVNGSKLQDLSLTGVKLADRSVTQLKHGFGSVSLAELKMGTMPAFKIAVSLQPTVVQALLSATGYMFFSIGMSTDKSGPFPDGAVTPAPTTAWADPALVMFNVVAVNPDPGVNVDRISFEFGALTTNYRQAVGSPPQAFIGRNSSGVARVPVGTTITTVTSAPFPILNIYVSWHVLSAT